MTTCKDINNLFPAYLEDVLSPEEKRRVEEHLHTCAGCRRDIADLHKAVSLLHNLDEVEPPPFFEQRIMAAIREEREQKQSVWRRLFYPLHIKIPIQALTTVFIVVFAFLVYQKSGPEVKQMAPLPAPVTESAKKQATPEILREPAISSTATQDRKTPPAATRAQEREHFAAPPVARETQQEEVANLPATLKEERPTAMVSRDTEAMAKTQKSVAKGEAETMTMPAMPSSGQRRKSKMAEVSGAARENKDMASAKSSLPAAQAVPMKRVGLNLTIQVPDTNRGRQEIEACLNRFNARIGERKQRGETIFLKAQIDARYIAAFLQQMEDIGMVRTNNERTEFAAGNVAVDIRIDRLP
ncbi:MAG: DUF2275 domain-containing protein [Smithella sp.]